VSPGSQSSTCRLWTRTIAEIVPPHRAHPLSARLDASHIARIRALKGAHRCQVGALDARQIHINNSSFGSPSGERAEAIMKPWLNVTEGAEYAGVSRDTIYTACERGELRHARISGRRAIRLKPAWIDEWIEKYTRGPEGSRALEVGSSMNALR